MAGEEGRERRNSLPERYSQVWVVSNELKRPFTGGSEKGITGKKTISIRCESRGPSGGLQNAMGDLHKNDGFLKKNTATG